MNKNTIFHLARHGQTQWNTEQRIQGQLDSLLTQQGESQALQLAKSCQSLNITSILTSSLGRAIQTATLCGQYLQMPVLILPGIEERHFGLWQGKLTPEVQDECDYHEITSQVTDCKPKQGESALQLLTRFETALKQQFQQSPLDTYLMITHGDVLRCFMSQFQQAGQSFTGYDYKNGEFISMSYNHVTGQFSPL